MKDIQFENSKVGETVVFLSSDLVVEVILQDANIRWIVAIWSRFPRDIQRRDEDVPLTDSGHEPFNNFSTGLGSYPGLC